MYSNFAIVASFFSLWLSTLLTNKLQLLVGFLIILTVGIFHGANDIVLILSLNKSKKIGSFFKILAYYVVIVLLGIAAFYIFPVVSLICFLIISGLHFGEQQWQSFKTFNGTKVNASFRAIYGLFVLFLLFVLHQVEVILIVQQITFIMLPKTLIPIIFYIISVLLICFFLYLYIYVENLRKQILLEAFYLLVFAIIFFSSSLIWGFAIFFVIWHSIPSIIDQIKFLHVDATFDNFIIYFKSALIYWIISLFGIAILYYLFKDKQIFNAIFFSFLAAITFPHAIVILKMFRKKLNN